MTGDSANSPAVASADVRHKNPATGVPESPAEPFRAVIRRGAATALKASLSSLFPVAMFHLAFRNARSPKARVVGNPRLPASRIAGIIALLLAAPGAAAAEPVDAAPETLRVLSYNIRHGRGMDNQVDLERQAAVLRAATPDLVALQEVDKHVKRSGNIDIAAELGAKLEMRHAFGAFMPHQGGEYGLAALSRFPILATRIHELPAGLEPRVALEIEVEIPRKNLDPMRISFVCVHFDWPRDDEARFNQASLLIKALRDRKHPVIIAGDYNDVRGSRTLDAFAAEFFIPESGGPTLSSSGPGREIDFISHRGLPERTKITVIPERMASDHLPVLAEIRLDE